MQSKSCFMCSIKAIAGLILSTVIVGCSTGKNNVLFVTTTSLGVDFDNTPPTASVAYNRVEGYIGPRYENGAVPPVLARIQSDGSIFNAKVRQLYATGAAAIIVANPQASNGPKELKGEKEVMFFGTTTTTGLKVGFSGITPDTFILGYKRQELSYIPLGHIQGGEDVYPSVLATLDTTAQAGPEKTAGLQGGQFFATGEAAELYAKTREIRDMFKKAAMDAFQALEACLVSPEIQDRKKKAWDKLKGIKTDQTKVNELYKRVFPNGTVAEEKRFEALHEKLADICDKPDDIKILELYEGSTIE